jgi:hypothetical protein
MIFGQKITIIIITIIKHHNSKHYIYIYITVVKELRSKMFRQHLGYYKEVFLKKTTTIIASFYEYKWTRVGTVASGCLMA